MDKLGRKKTNEEFVKQLEECSPSIIPLEPYVNATTKLRCKCKICGYEWLGIPNNLLRGEGCLSCSGNLPWTTETFILEMKKRMPSITIIGDYKNNKTKIAYTCNNCGRTGEAIPSSLLRGHGCKYCGRIKASTARRKTNEAFIKQLAEKNPGVQPLEEYVNSSTRIRCRCTCGNIWSTTPVHLLSGQRCKQCQPNRTTRTSVSHKGPKKSNDQFQAELQIANPTIEAREEYNGTANKKLFRCRDCGYEWHGWPRSVLNGQGCPACKKRWNTSFPEQAVFFYVRQVYADAINSYKKGFGQSELDIYIPSIKTGIEYDGRNWHRNKQQTEINKYERCRDLGITLIRIRESELQDNASLICDHQIISEYGHIKRFPSLDQCIHELMSFLNVFCDINTQRDRFLIMEQYYSTLRSKSLGVLYPAISQEWYQPKNGAITPFMVLPKSNESFWWECPDCGNIYLMLVSNRTSSHGCPKCGGQERKTQEAFVKEIESINPEIEIIGTYFNVNTPIEFRCKNCGRVGKTTPRSLRRGTGCTFCSRKKAQELRTMPESVFLRRVHKNYPYIEILGKYVNSQEHILCKCKRCNHEWSPLAHALVSGRSGCPSCAGRAKKSVRCIETGLIYESVNKAERETNISHSRISMCCNHKANTAGGFHWEFVTNE